MVSLRYPMEVPLVGDSKATLQALLQLLDRKEDRSWQEKVESDVHDWWQTLEHRAQASADPINPELLFDEISPRLPDGAILAADSGSSANWYARNIKIRSGMLASLSGNLASMGPGVPYAIAAKFTHPGRPAVAMVGDGAMQMNGINGLITIAKYWEEWSDPRLVIVVVHNNDLNQVTWEQRVFEGDPKFAGSQDVPDFPYARYAEMLGLGGVRIERPDELADGLDRAFGAERPVVVDVLTDPNVPPLPPHISLKQARQFAFAIAKGDPDAYEIIESSAKQMLAGILPGR
jgi:pyruvate dehydrogenase (quinone)